MYGREIPLKKADTYTYACTIVHKYTTHARTETDPQIHPERHIYKYKNIQLQTHAKMFPHTYNT